jgi:hypothetical protein
VTEPSGIGYVTREKEELKRMAEGREEMRR